MIVGSTANSAYIYVWIHVQLGRFNWFIDMLAFSPAVTTGQDFRSTRCIILDSSRGQFINSGQVLIIVAHVSASKISNQQPNLHAPWMRRTWML